MIHFLIISTSILFCGYLHGSEIEGVVRALGSAANAQIFLTQNRKKGEAVCQNATSKLIGRLVGMTIKGQGQWQGENQRKCFSLESFEVTKVSSGRQAWVGVLQHKNGSFYLKQGDGVSHDLGSIPDGLKSMIGEKVILDRKIIGSQTSNWRIVTFSRYPTK